MSTEKAPNDDVCGKPKSDAPCVFVVQDESIHRMGLARVLADGKCRVVEIHPNAILPRDLIGLNATPDLFVFPIDPSDRQTVDRVDGVHSHDKFRRVPILGVVNMNELCLSVDELRSLGVVGVTDAQISGEHLVFRVNQLVRPSLQRRRWERVEVFFSVDVDVDGVRTREQALTLSEGGIGIRSTRALPVNTSLRVEFQPEAGIELQLDGRVVQADVDPRAVPNNRLGIVFTPPGPEAVAQLDRLLAELRAK